MAAGQSVDGIARLGQALAEMGHAQISPNYRKATGKRE